MICWDMLCNFPSRQILSHYSLVILGTTGPGSGPKKSVLAILNCVHSYIYRVCGLLLFITIDGEIKGREVYGGYFSSESTHNLDRQWIHHDGANAF